MIKNYLKKDIVLDSAQEEILDILEEHTKIPLNKHFLSFFCNKNFNAGIYIYGDVGRGKTMLAKAFYDSLEISKKYMHYQEFMTDTHKILHQNNKLNSKESARIISNSYAKNFRILFIDELEIKDVTDGMLMYNLLIEFEKSNLFVVITSNSKPDYLYSNGVLRERILNLINFLKTRFKILNLSSSTDYRVKHINNLDRVIYPLTEENLRKKDEIFINLKIKQFAQDNINMFGRKIEFKEAYNDILFTSFAEICERNLSYSDYIEICKKYKVIIITNVLRIKNEATDILIRFVNLIDNIYFNNVLLFIFLEVEPESLYIGTNRADDFKRCVSRLKEMGSSEYFNNSKYAKCKKES